MPDRSSEVDEKDCFVFPWFARQCRGNNFYLIVRFCLVTFFLAQTDREYGSNRVDANTVKSRFSSQLIGNDLLDGEKAGDKRDTYRVIQSSLFSSTTSAQDEAANCTGSPCS